VPGLHFGSKDFKESANMVPFLSIQKTIELYMQFVETTLHVSEHSKSLGSLNDWESISPTFLLQALIDSIQRG